MFQTRACVEENVILTDGNSLAKHIHPGGHHFCAYFLVHVFAKNKRKRLFTKQSLPISTMTITRAVTLLFSVYTQIRHVYSVSRRIPAT